MGTCRSNGCCEPKHDAGITITAYADEMQAELSVVARRTIEIAKMTRRHFLQTTLASALATPARAADAPRPPRVLLRSSWQTVNIGDIGHTPGMLALLEKHLPDVEVRLWPGNVDNGVKEMLLARFPKLIIVQGTEALKTAFAECDFLLHGSGPSLVAEKDVERWRRETGTRDAGFP